MIDKNFVQAESRYLEPDNDNHYRLFMVKYSWYRNEYSGVLAEKGGGKDNNNIYQSPQDK